MSTIYLSESHHLDADARERALQALHDYLSQNLAARVTRRDAELIFSGTGYSGTVTLDEDRVHGELKLGLLMRPMKGTITREIKAVLATYLEGKSAL
jgi:putative polyhydroxyalkanoate system protein